MSFEYQDTVLTQVRTGLLLSFFLASFVCFTQAMRLFNHFKFLVFAKPVQETEEEQQDQALARLDLFFKFKVGSGVCRKGLESRYIKLPSKCILATFMNTLGFRFLYLSVCRCDKIYQIVSDSLLAFQ
jgi:uncharacterized membrane protein